MQELCRKWDAKRANIRFWSLIRYKTKEKTTITENDPEMEKLKKFGFLNGTTENLTIHTDGATLIKLFDHPDCFIFCTSQKSSPEIMREFGGADSCVEIFKPEPFYELLTTTLNRITPVIFRGYHLAVYQEREESWNGIDWGCSPALVKEPKFSKQLEIRAIWQPRFNLPIKPVVLADHRLTSFCRPVTLL